MSDIIIENQPESVYTSEAFFQDTPQRRGAVVFTVCTPYAPALAAI